MEQRDYDNLKFLMSLKTKEDWRQFASSVDEEDLRYAASLLAIANWEMIDEIVVSDPLLEAQALCELLKERTK